MADHILRDEHGDMLLAVVHGECFLYEAGINSRTAGPGLDDFLLAGLIECFDFLQQILVTERTLFNASRHCSPSLLSLFTVAPSDDQRIALLLVLAGLDAHCLLAPRSHRGLAADRALAFAAAVRVIARVHCRTSDGRTDAQPSGAAGFAEVDQAVILIADDADGGTAVVEELADLAGAQSQRCVSSFKAQDLRAAAGASGQLSAFARNQLDAVDEGSFRNALQLHRVADLDVLSRSADDLGAAGQFLRAENVSLLAVGVVDQSDVGAAVRIVFDAGDRADDAVLVALEVDDAVLLLVASALMAGGDAAVVVAAAFLVELGKQALLRRALGDHVVCQGAHVAAPSACRLVLDDCHVILLSFRNLSGDSDFLR